MDFTPASTLFTFKGIYYLEKAVYETCLTHFSTMFHVYTPLKCFQGL